MAEFGEINPVVLKVEKPKVYPSTESGRKISSVLEKTNIDFELQNTGVEQMPEMLVTNQNENLDEKCVRVYRGVGNVETVLNQIPYAMRVVDSRVATQTDQGLKTMVEDLAENPSYEKLADYMQTVAQKQNSRDRERFENDFKKIEDSMLKDGDKTDIARELKYNTFGHTGGLTAESGISPYLSASLDSKEAMGFISNGGALMVIDIPISKLNFLTREANGEIFIKGALESRYIKAIIPKTKEIYSQERESVLNQVKSKIDSVEGNVYRGEELTTVVGDYAGQIIGKEREQNVIDLQKIKNKRAQKLIQSFSNRIPGLNELVIIDVDSNVDLYTKVKLTIYDHLKSELGGIGENLDEFEYKQATFNSGAEKYDRDKVTDDMLNSLRSLVNGKKEHYEYIMDRRRQREMERKKTG